MITDKRNKKKHRFIFRMTILLIFSAAIIFALVSNFQKDKSVYDEGDKAPD